MTWRHKQRQISVDFGTITTLNWSFQMCKYKIFKDSSSCYTTGMCICFLSGTMEPMYWCVQHMMCPSPTRWNLIEVDRPGKDQWAMNDSPACKIWENNLVQVQNNVLTGSATTRKSPQTHSICQSLQHGRRLTRLKYQHTYGSLELCVLLFPLFIKPVAAVI